MLKFLPLLIFTNNVLALIVEPRKWCIKSSIVRGPCHVCECDHEGVFKCKFTECEKDLSDYNYLKKECEPEMVYNYKELYCTCDNQGFWRSNNCRATFRMIHSNRDSHRHRHNHTEDHFIHPSIHHNLPEIQEGTHCIPGKLYRVDCNTCRCGEDDTLMCSKMACLHHSIRQYKDSRHKNRQLELQHMKHDVNEIEEKKSKKEKKQFESENLKKKALRQGKKDCQPGKTYIKDCSKCLCTNEKSSICIPLDNCSKKTLNRMDEAEVSKLVLSNLERLNHVTEKCEPGKRYRVDCNVCFCSHKSDLICTYRYCLDTDTYAGEEAKKLSGKRCKTGFTQHCSKCDCVNGFAECKPMLNCNLVTGKQLLSGAVGDVKLKLNVEKDKCIPNMTYNVHCNQCYCQPDGSLRCTQRICLSHSQAESLQKRSEYLEQHGI